MKILIQPNCGIPIYLQVAERIIWNISWRKLKMGDPLPPTRVLAAENGLDHKTVAKGYAELRSQGVAFPHRPTGSYVIMSQAQHLAEVKRDAFIKVMECLLRGIRMLRRMPPELEPSKSIQEYFQKLKDCEAQINELNAVVSAESAKPAFELPGIISPLGIDEALAALGTPSPAGTPDAALAHDEKPAPATNAQQSPTREALWNNPQNPCADPLSAPARQETTEDSNWNNTNLGLCAAILHARPEQACPEPVEGVEGLPSDQRSSNMPNPSPPVRIGHQETIPDNPWNNDENLINVPGLESAQPKTTEDIPWNNSQNISPEPDRIPSEMAILT